MIRTKQPHWFVQAIDIYFICFNWLLHLAIHITLYGLGWSVAGLPEAE